MLNNNFGVRSSNEICEPLLTWGLQGFIKGATYETSIITCIKPRNHHNVNNSSNDNKSIQSVCWVHDIVQSAWCVRMHFVESIKCKISWGSMLPDPRMFTWPHLCRPRNLLFTVSMVAMCELVQVVVWHLVFTCIHVLEGLSGLKVFGRETIRYSWTNGPPWRPNAWGWGCAPSYAKCGKPPKKRLRRCMLMTAWPRACFL